MWILFECRRIPCCDTLIGLSWDGRHKIKYGTAIVEDAVRVEYNNGRKK